MIQTLLNRFNEELDRGPLAGLVTVTNLVSDKKQPVGETYINPQFAYKSSFKTKNRLKAYQGYFDRLKRKYCSELLKLRKQ